MYIYIYIYIYRYEQYLIYIYTHIGMRSIAHKAQSSTDSVPRDDDQDVLSCDEDNETG